MRLVAVSKTKPAAAIQAAFDDGQRHFGENYVQELLEKAPSLSTDIKWHFIGNLQSNKAKKIVKQVPNLFMVETVDTRKLAKTLNTACVSAEREQLRVLVQVNTSGEETKGGVTPGGECVELAEYIQSECEGLQFSGLMTIGKCTHVCR